MLEALKRKFTDQFAVEAAEKKAVESQLPGRDDGPADAYRHLIWAGELTRRFGESKARAILYGHEIEGRIKEKQPEGREEMDLHNNEIGIKLGKNAKNFDEVVKAAQQTIDESRDGDRPNGKGATWLPREKWTKHPKDKNKVELPESGWNWKEKIDWENGIVTEPYQYPFGGEEHHYERHPEISPLNPAPTSGSEENSETRVNFIFDQKDENDGGEDAEKSPVDIRENPDVKAFSARIGGETAVTPQTLLLKDNKLWTEDERDMVMNYRFDLPWGNPTRDAMEKAITGWYEHIYGTGNVRYDSTGRMIRPQPITILPKEPTPFAAKNGMDLAKAAKIIEEMILGQVGENNHLPGVVKNLQRGLNLTKPEEQEGLKLDGDYGPKTDFALKSTLAQKGTGKVKEALALGQIADHAEQSKYGQAESGLADFAKSTLGPLYPSGKEEAPNKVLQESLNDLGRQYKEDDWQDLKLDGWIGPKTEEVYSTIASLAEPDEIAASFGRSLRFI